ncbi:hypothetical protein PHSY_004128 [Pseudozyma hubeiensis SY62]|uniref:Dynactin subunit 4 n=1 Tax=Pseudozyma hubeiensis (strain SY62) TaxID=1305764 RepID=R9P527_PSEHS|nr:hypothetical protein PHSY_004128 [Pseudozyma hubeiensis SY62]GAC96548.1 hypothetical protein PHSY_004128 [Pseudozyma hubeiensis SY62]
MATPHVLYYCSCNQVHGNVASTSSLASPPPGLPARSTASRYAFQPLESLYFCDECDRIRCNRCVTVDISSYYCPNCLFEVPGASVKAEKNRCSRNCFECPCCQHTLSVVASDLNNSAARSLDPTDPAASQGEPPYYLACSVCRWDSKSVGLVFEKPTGLSLQLQRSEENAADVLEFDRIKDHFDPYLKTQTQAAITSAAVGSGSSSRTRPLPASSSSAAAVAPSATKPATSSRSARAAAARNAATAALQSSKLLRDLPHLAHPRHPAHSARSAPTEPDELKPYRALNPWQPPRDDRSRSGAQSVPSIGVVAKREKHRRDYIARIQSSSSQPFASLDDKITSLEQRWSSVSIADQPVRVAELRPTRVALKSKISKRCPACRHIVIKPDIKAASNRFKIKLVALNFLPEFQISLANQQPHLDPLRFRSAGTAGSNTVGAGLTASALRRRPASVLPSATDPVGITSSILTSSQDIDVNNLVAGQTYSYQIAVTNPLDDPVQVEMSFVRFVDPSLGGGAAAVPPLPESKYIFSSQPSSGTSSAHPTQVTAGEQPQRLSRRPRFGWQAYPSATTIPLNAFNEVWDLEDAEDIYSKSEFQVQSQSTDEASPHRHAVKTAVIEDVERAASEPAWVIQEHEDDDDAGRASRTVGRGRKPFIQKGHTTTFYLDLVLSATATPGPVELAMHVTYRYTGTASTSDQASGGQMTGSVGKDFSFWTSITLGTVPRDQ